jgi:hypothetical protein
MTYTFTCEKGHITEIEKSMKDDIPDSVSCMVCNELAFRNWSDTAIHVPEHMRANSYLNRDYAGNTSYLKDRMKNMPSGKRKICYQGGGVPSNGG